MEISAAIHSIGIGSSKLTNSCFLQFRPPFFSQFSLSSKPNSPPHNSLSSSHRNVPRVRQQWRDQLTVTRALSDETTATVDSAAKSVNTDSSLAVKKKATDVYADLKGTSIFLVGMNSAMKTSVGKLIADLLRYYYFDSDSVVEEAAGQDTSGRSFRERDEDGFRESETEVLTQLSSMGRLVVNAGDGAVQSLTNLALVRHGVLVWIDVPLNMVAKGVVGGDGQSNNSSPDSFSEELGQLTKLYEENRTEYAIADATVSLENVASKLGYEEFEQVTAEDMALVVLEEIEKLTAAKKKMVEAQKAQTPF